MRVNLAVSKQVLKTLLKDGKPILTRSTSKDALTETTVLTDGRSYKLQRDATGRPITLLIDGIAAAQATWRPNGMLSKLSDGNTDIQPRQHKNGWPNGVLISAPSDSGQTSQWLEEKWDVMGRPIKITDSSGFEYTMNYDDQGRMKKFGRLTKDGKLMGASLIYNKDALITDIDSSWGKEKREYADNGLLKHVEISKQGEKSSTSFGVHGRPTIHLAFDGGNTTWRYSDYDTGGTLLAVELPNSERINYTWHDSDDTHNVKVKLGNTLVQTLSDTTGRVVAMSWGSAAQ